MSEDKQDDLYEEKVDTSWYDGPGLEELRHLEVMALLLRVEKLLKEEADAP